MEYVTDTMCNVEKMSKAHICIHKNLKLSTKNSYSLFFNELISAHLSGLKQGNFGKIAVFELKKKKH